MTLIWRPHHTVPALFFFSFTLLGGTNAHARSCTGQVDRRGAAGRVCSIGANQNLDWVRTEAATTGTKGEKTHEQWKLKMPFVLLRPSCKNQSHKFLIVRLWLLVACFTINILMGNMQCWMGKYTVLFSPSQMTSWTFTVKAKFLRVWACFFSYEAFFFACFVL